MNGFENLECFPSQVFSFFCASRFPEEDFSVFSLFPFIHCLQPQDALFLLSPMEQLSSLKDLLTSLFQIQQGPLEPMALHFDPEAAIIKNLESYLSLEAEA